MKHSLLFASGKSFVPISRASSPILRDIRKSTMLFQIKKYTRPKLLFTVYNCFHFTVVQVIKIFLYHSRVVEMFLGNPLFDGSFLLAIHTFTYGYLKLP